ncbi:DUF2780 domain-containing protein [Shewanella sp. AS1]|uniref:DUF2780 domain-containing protein n=1 Tax=Shewanella sp. AS1 TaxID=2907626 RepID=UPI001F1C8E49|nr:DUF2780 domain-containing protein [Shewanella sp. AS1]MCE9680121.1 DUF2780 domain-containing protein [Shewanella sp. AS1]
MKVTLLLSALLATLALYLPQALATGQTDANSEEPTASSTPASGDLVGSVMSQLGLSQSQAEGGLGSLFGLAKSNLGDDSFGPIADAVPNMDSLLSAAPSADSGSGMSGLLSKAGSLGSSLQGGAQVYDAFEKLGISKELAQPMVGIVKDYLDSTAGEGTADLLMQGVGTLM